jgi:hypothetical protein
MNGQDPSWASSGGAMEGLAGIAASTHYRAPNSIRPTPPWSMEHKVITGGTGKRQR